MLRVIQFLARFTNIYLSAWPGNYQRKKISVLKKLFVEASAFMNASGEEYWLDFGTLLGYHREQGIIAHDIDVDFSMHEKSYPIILANKCLIPKGFSLHDTSNKHHGPKLYLSYRGFDVDIYFYKDEGQTMRSYEKTRFPNESQSIPKDLIYPLKRASLFGQQVFVPCKEEAYLKKIYGYLGTGGNRDKVTGFWHPPKV